MSNPVEGQDFVVNMVTTEELTGATVTIEYRNNNGDIVIDVTPTSVDTSSKTISWKMEDSITAKGIWEIRTKIINSAGDISFSNPPVTVTFDPKYK